MTTSASSASDFTTIASIIFQRGNGGNDPSVSSAINSLKAGYSNESSMDSEIKSLSSEYNDDSSVNSEVNNLSSEYSSVSTADSEFSSLSSNYGSLSDFVKDNVTAKPVNIFPNYWVDVNHNDYPTINVPVEKGKQYTLSFVIASNQGKTGIRAGSSWNVADQWGDIKSNDSGVSNINDIYKATFTAPKTGNMPIQFIFTNVKNAMNAGQPTFMIRRITMTQSSDYIPYSDCNNNHQSLKDITGDAGMDANAMFGTL